jgi:hypothetical protein
MWRYACFDKKGVGLFDGTGFEYGAYVPVYHDAVVCLGDCICKSGDYFLKKQIYFYVFGDSVLYCPYY